jgi:hypothetical protein
VVLLSVRKTTTPHHHTTTRVSLHLEQIQATLEADFWCHNQTRQNMEDDLNIFENGRRPKKD